MTKITPAHIHARARSSVGHFFEYLYPLLNQKRPIEMDWDIHVMSEAIRPFGGLVSYMKLRNFQHFSGFFSGSYRTQIDPGLQNGVWFVMTSNRMFEVRILKLCKDTMCVGSNLNSSMPLYKMA